MPEHNFHPRYRPDIDGLRALAILAVVAYHAFARYAPGGFIGVDIFFVISGYLISLIIFKSLAHGDFSFGEFCAHRVKRLFPALLLVTGACYVFGWFTLLPDEFKQLGKHIAGGLGFVQNIVLWQEAGYFDVSSELKPLMHLWSLAVEEQFYLTYPLFLWLVWKSRAKLLAAIVCLCLASFALSVHGVHGDSTKAFFSPQTRFWELMFGSILAYVQSFGAWKPAYSRRVAACAFHCLPFLRQRSEKERAAWIASFMSVLGLLLILWAVAAYESGMAYPGPRALVPVIGATLLIVAGPDAWVNRHILSRQPVVWIGLISYPLYLWHWPLLAFARIIEAGTPSREIRLAAIAASFVLAALTYHCVEKRIRGIRSGWMKITVLGLLALLIGYAGYNAYSRDGYQFRVRQHALISAGVEDWDYPGTLQPRPFADLTLYTNSDKEPEVLLFGDSHIEQYGPKVLELSKNGNARAVTFMTRGGCPPIPYVDEHHYRICGTLADKFWQYLEQHPSVKSVILSGCFNCYFIHQTAPATSSSDVLRYYFRKDSVTQDFRGGNGKNAAIHELADFSKEIVARGYLLYVILDNPKDERFDPAKIIQSANGGRPAWLTASHESRSSSFPLSPREVALEHDLKARLMDTGAVILEQANIVCPQDICSPVDATGRPIYKDSDHMRPFFVREKMHILDGILGH